MNPEANGRFVVNRGLDGCLELYPLDLWQRMRSALQKKLNKFNKKHREFMRSFLSGATELSLDSADRLNFPNHLLKQCDITNEVYLTPGQGTIEMWSVSSYESRMAAFNPDEYEDVAEEVMGNLDIWGSTDNQE